MTTIHTLPISKIARTKLFKDLIGDDDSGTFTLEITNLEKTEEYKIDEYVFYVRGTITILKQRYYKNEVLKQCWDSPPLCWL